MVKRAVDKYGARVVTMLPSNVAGIVKSQNPVMGAQDITAAGRDEFLIGIEKWPTGRADDVSDTEQSDAIEIIDRESVSADRVGGAEVIKARGRRTRHKLAEKTRTGIEASYDDC